MIQLSAFKLCILSIFLSISIFSCTTYKTISYTKSIQQGNNWCWAAACQVILSNLNIEKNQCEIVEEVKDMDCCLEGEDPTKISYKGTICDKTANIEPGLAPFNVIGSYIEFPSVNTPNFNFQWIQNKLNENSQPIPVFIINGEVSNHIKLIVGVDDSNGKTKVVLFDPQYKKEKAEKFDVLFEPGNIRYLGYDFIPK